MSDFTQVDTVFEWKEEGDADYKICRLRIYWLSWDTAIVIAINCSDKPVQRIDNTIKKIIFLIRHNYDLAPNKIMLIEHCPAENYSDEDTYLQIMLINNEAIRYEIDRSLLVELIGKTI